MPNKARKKITTAVTTTSGTTVITRRTAITILPRNGEAYD